MNKTKVKLTSSVESVTLFYFSIAVMLHRLNIGVLTASINIEKDKMIKFGIDPVKLKEFFDFYNSKEKKVLSKKELEELTLVCYRYLLYFVVKGVSVIGWLDKIFPDSASSIFKKTSWNEAILKQMIALKSLVYTAMTDSSMHFKEIPFDTAMHAWAKRFQEAHPNTANVLGIKKISLDDLNKFLECFIQDCNKLIMK